MRIGSDILGPVRIRPRTKTSGKRSTGEEKIGLDPENMGQPAGYVFPVAIFCSFLISYGVSAVMGKAGVRGAFPGAALGIFVGTALVATTLATHHAFSFHSIEVMFVDGGKELVTFGLVGLIHGAWPAKEAAPA